jgi:hypothetical protein
MALSTNIGYTFHAMASLWEEHHQRQFGISWEYLVWGEPSRYCWRKFIFFGSVH